MLENRERGDMSLVAVTGISHDCLWLTSGLVLNVDIQKDPELSHTVERVK